jgi:hypothetical protein
MIPYNLPQARNLLVLWNHDSIQSLYLNVYFALPSIGDLDWKRKSYQENFLW